MLLRLKSCGRCSGDLVLEEDDWRCWQCGHYYYPYILQLVDPLAEAGSPSAVGHGRGRRRKWPYAGMPDRDVNSLIRAKNTSEDRWWARNKHIVAYLDEGRRVWEIALLTARSPRQIRSVRERLSDLRGGSGGYSR